MLSDYESLTELMDDPSWGRDEVAHFIKTIATEGELCDLIFDMYDKIQKMEESR